MPKQSKDRTPLCSLTPLTVNFLKLALIGLILQAAVLAIVVHDTLSYAPTYARLYYPQMMRFIGQSMVLIPLDTLILELIHQAKKK